MASPGERPYAAAMIVPAAHHVTLPLARTAAFRHRVPRRAGITLLETAVTLMLLGMLLGMALPPLGRARDAFAVRAAADALAAELARTRAVAVARGGAALVVDCDAARTWIEDAASGRVGRATDLAAAYGVRIDGAGAERLVLRYDALGIGRMTSRTFRLRRGRADARIIVSAYGRVRRP